MIDFHDSKNVKNADKKIRTFCIHQVFKKDKNPVAAFFIIGSDSRF